MLEWGENRNFFITVIDYLRTISTLVARRVGSNSWEHIRRSCGCEMLSPSQQIVLDERTFLLERPAKGADLLLEWKHLV